MTYDVDVDTDNDPYKIDISSLEDDEGNHRKRRFEKGISALLADPYFMVIYVPEDGAKMQVIRPAINSYHRQRMIKKINEAKRIPSFYYALSHIWRITKCNRHLWEEIGNYVDDEDGDPTEPVSMRPEKREPLLQLLRDHPDSYWWIDVLCARTDTPLNIMYDIYSWCLACYAMIDCDPRMIHQLHFLMRDVQEKFPDPQYASYGKQADKALSQMTGLLYQLMQSEWWKRVWTWQEVAAPFGHVWLMAESSTMRDHSSIIALDDLLDYSLSAAFRVMRVALDHDPNGASPGFLYAGNVYLWLNELSYCRTSNRYRVGKMGAEQLYSLIMSWSESSRRSYFPEDYVYGVLGVFQINIPRMRDPNAVWQHFLYELDNYMETTDIKNETFLGKRIIGLSDRAYEFDLRKARDMVDVYQHLLEVKLA